MVIKHTVLVFFREVCVCVRVFVCVLALVHIYVRVRAMCNYPLSHNVFHNMQISLVQYRFLQKKGISLKMQLLYKVSDNFEGIMINNSVIREAVFLYARGTLVYVSCTVVCSVDN